MTPREASSIIRFIFNPAAGRTRPGRRLLGRVGELAHSPRRKIELCVTDGPAHATALAREAAAAGYPLVVAVGGDGTLNEVAQALLNTPTALGIVPCGSGNGLARYLGIPARPERALALLLRSERTIAVLDTGIADGHPFFNAMGLGLDAEVSRVFNFEGARRFDAPARRGLPAYALTALAAYRGAAPARYRIDDGRRTEEVTALLVAVANSDQYGSNARIAPGARADDGLLDLVVIPPVGLLRAAGLTARLFTGSLDRGPGVLRRRAARFRIERDAPGLLHTDGETHEAGAVVEVSVLPRSLRVVVPPGRTAGGPAWLSGAVPATTSGLAAPARKF